MNKFQVRIKIGKRQLLRAYNRNRGVIGKLTINFQGEIPH